MFVPIDWRPTLWAGVVVGMSQVVAAVDATTLLAADDPARRARTKCYYPKQRRVEHRVDRETGPDGV